jgi:uncharacterized protein (DUF433 family)
MVNDYIEVREGSYYLAKSRVSLASIVYAFRDGASPETIRENFPSLSLAQVYGGIAFYLNRPEESEAYLLDLKKKWAQLEHDGQQPTEQMQNKLDEARQRLFAEKS